MCVWNIWTDVKLLLRVHFHVTVSCSTAISISSDSTLTCLFLVFSISIIFRMIQQGIALSLAADVTCGGFNVLRFIDFNQFSKWFSRGVQSTVETAPNEAIHLCWKQSLINSGYLRCFSDMATGQAKNPTWHECYGLFHLHCCRNLELLSVLWLSGLRRHGRLWNLMYLTLGLDCWFTGFSSQQIALTIHF